MARTVSMPESLSANYYENVGYSGTGSVTQSGGTNNVGYNLTFASNPATSGNYTLNGGYLWVANYEDVGYSGAGTFTQSGGTHVVANDVLYIADNSGSSGA